jgi:hypothetical protein
MRNLSRRELFSSAAVGAVAVGTAGCTLFQQNANGSYGLSAAAIAFIQNAVALANQYVPAVESIAATAASLFGPAYTTIVTVGSDAINTVVAYLENIIANPPTVGASRVRNVYAKYGLPPPSGALIGYTKNGVPIFAE